MKVNAGILCFPFLNKNRVLRFIKADKRRCCGAKLLVFYFKFQLTGSQNDQQKAFVFYVNVSKSVILYALNFCNLAFVIFPAYRYVPHTFPTLLKLF